MATRDRRAGRRRAPRRARSPSSSAPTPSPRPSSRPWPTPASPTCVRGGERFFARKEVREAILLLRGAARGDDGSKPLGELARDVLGGGRLDASGRRPAAARSASAGSRCRRWRRWPTTLVAAAPEAPAARPRARAGRARRRAARPDRRGRHAGVAARGQGPGVGLPSSSSGAPTGCCRSRMADGPAAVEEERRLLYVGADPGPRAARLSWSRPAQPRRPRPRGAPSRFLDGAAAVLGEGARSAPDAAGRKAGAASRARSPSRRGAAPAGPTWSPPPRARSVAATTARPPTTRRRSRRCATWRLTVASEAKVPAYVVFTDATLTAIAERSRPTSRPSPRSRASGPPSSSATARRSWRSWVVPTRSRSPKTLLLQRNPRRDTP